MACSKKTNNTAIKAAERRNLAIKLRRQGLTYEAIGAKLNVNASRAYKIVSDALKLIRVDTNETGEEIKTLELQRLDKFLEVANKQAETGSLQAIDRCVRIMERRAKLLGLDSPDKIDVETKQQLVINLIRKSCRKEDDVRSIE